MKQMLDAKNLGLHYKIEKYTLEIRNSKPTIYLLLLLLF